MIDVDFVRLIINIIIIIKMYKLISQTYFQFVSNEWLWVNNAGACVSHCVCVCVCERERDPLRSCCSFLLLLKAAWFE